ncbi:MAG: queuosine salvage family protein, partial [Bacteroidota bacterium]
MTENADFVCINYDRIEDYATQLPLEKVANPPLDPVAHYLDQGADTLAFFLTLETINFGSGYFPHLEQEVEECGYFTVATALANHYREKGIISANQLARFTTTDCVQLFEQNLNNENMLELMERFAEALNQLGRFLLQHFDGQFA